MDFKFPIKELCSSSKIGAKKLFFNSKNKFTSFSKKKKIIVIVLCVLVATLLCTFAFGGNDEKEEEKSYIEAQAEIGNITETIEQSGVVEPYERYEITSLVKGEIISCPVEEGDFVNKGDTLYKIDDEDAQLNMEKAQMSLDEANESVNNLNIYAPASGKLTEFSIKVGDNVGASVIGKIKNSEKLAIDVPFSSSDFQKISVGDRVTAVSALYMTTLSGRVIHKYTAAADTGMSGSTLRNIEIEIENPGALSDGTTFAATVHTSYGDVNSAGSGTIDGGTITSIRAEVSGEVSYIGAKEGDYVSKGQLIARLVNNSLVNSQKSSQLNVKSNQKTLDNYNITAPISGTVITKNSKAGDKIDNSNSQTVMMVVADMSKMKFTIDVDELDISDIHLGQTAIVDADALPEQIFEAKVTTIASEGVSSGDGVTTFTVELTIDEPGELKSGMNVNANILINEAYDVVTIPEEALMSVRGTSATVIVKADGDSNMEKESKKQEQKKTADKEDAENVPEGVKGEMPKGTGGEMPDISKDSRNMPDANVPDGCEIRQVVIGISDGTNVEIVSGISEGEIVVYIPSSVGASNPFAAMMGAMGGGMPGVRMQQGGGNRAGGGGMPGGR